MNYFKPFLLGLITISLFLIPLSLTLLTPTTVHAQTPNPNVATMSATQKATLITQLRTQLISLIKQLIILLQEKLRLAMGGTTGGGGGNSGGNSTASTQQTTTTTGGTTNPPITPPVIATPGSCSTISQYGITWTFDKAYPCGQFVTGDWWVVGPVRIVSINPPATGSGNLSRNGYMINPISSKNEAFDGRDKGTGYFDQSLWKVRGDSFTLNPQESLVSSISTNSLNEFEKDVVGENVNVAGGYGVIRSIAVLTALASTPGNGNWFRPPYFGTSKPLYSADNLHSELLSNIEPLSGAPSLSSYENYTKRPWYNAFYLWSSQVFNPLENMPNYGVPTAYTVGNAGLLLNLNYPISQKRTLLRNMVQIGIDNYHILTTLPVSQRDIWRQLPAHTMGRYFPILLAGTMLNNQSMRDVSLLSGVHLAEQEMAYYGGSSEQLWTGWQNSGHPYASNVLYVERVVTNNGAPTKYENVPLSGWNDYPYPVEVAFPYDKFEPYRRSLTPSLVGEALAASLITGMKQAWNSDAFFSYIDRWMYENDSEVVDKLVNAATTENWTDPPLNPKQRGYWVPVGGTTYPNNWVRNMFITYRPTLGVVTPPSVPACTSFTYSTWGTCSSSGTQTRTITSSSPNNCTGGNPVTTQSCTPPVTPPPTTSTTPTYQSNQTYTFNGTSDYIDLGTSKFSIDQTNEFTIAFRIKIPSQTMPSYSTIISRGQYVYPFLIRLDSNRNIQVVTRTVDTSYLTSNSQLNYDTWYHVAVSYKNGERKIYLNGVVDKGDNLSGTLDVSAGQPTDLGRAPNNDSGYFNGSIDDLRIYNTALSATEIQSLYNQTQASNTKASQLASVYQSLTELLGKLSGMVEK